MRSLIRPPDPHTPPDESPAIPIEEYTKPSKPTKGPKDG